MTIVIKTQSGNLVFNPKNIYVCTNEQVFELRNITGENGGDCDYLGAYKTEKRAREIIFDIYNHLDDVASIREYVGCPVFAYEMPKE